ncbi:MAG: cytochrome c5 [Lentisphaeria bacterium]|jgi:cytochrome c5
MKTMYKIAAVLLALGSAYAFAETLEDRLKPAGSVCMAGEACAAAPVQVASSDGPRSGATVYETKCALCHGSGAAGAPKIGDSAAWAPRVAKGMDALYSGAINGINGMPAKGLCFDCSDEEMNAAVDHMVDTSR